MDALAISLSSTENEELEPIQVDWQLKSFDGQQAQIQMDLDSIFEQDVDTEIYDKVSIQFNDANRNFASQSGKGINFGQTVQW